MQMRALTLPHTFEQIGATTILENVSTTTFNWEKERRKKEERESSKFYSGDLILLL